MSPQQLSVPPALITSVEPTGCQPPGPGCLPTLSQGRVVSDTCSTVTPPCPSLLPPPYRIGRRRAISAFVSLIITGRFLVAAMLLLLVEVSNIFLTIRMLLKMSNVPSPVLYEANKYVNLVMYFAFRLAPQAYLTWYFLRYVEVQGQGAFLTANLLMLDAMILMYFSRLLRSDFFPSLRKGSVGRDVDGEKFLID
ncbi:PREDICTED: calfacilitin [Charadrius vociferus]|uniref:calfacilitin n=1 Tax=Charadrius vociferus TaxID=50402 RepID=UPI00052176DD|nr:PREDICTED: calfacilitin [Charadrius vociferus]